MHLPRQATGRDRLGRGHGPAAPSSRWLQRPVLARSADRDLGDHLGKELSDLGVVLHDVSFPPHGAPVDHVVVAPSGIWLVDSLHLHGRVERREFGPRRDVDTRFFLDGVERLDLVDELGLLRHAHGRLKAMNLGDVAVHRVVCVIDASWPLMGRPFQVRHVWITWPQALSEKIRSSGMLPIARAREIAAAISVLEPA
ncbi:MAG: NERD domain-containing protein [Ilumatobacter sp.]|nr:NERD domain-containing protein [Ilumatobacter sp.]